MSNYKNIHVIYHENNWFVNNPRRFIAYTLVTSLSLELKGWSVTTLNIVSGVVAITLGVGLVIAGAMANDSGKGGLFVSTFQWMSLSYPLIYLAGLVGSIAARIQLVNATH